MVKCYTKKGVAPGKNNKICFDDNGKILNSSKKNNGNGKMPKKAPPPKSDNPFDNLSLKDLQDILKSGKQPTSFKKLTPQMISDIKSAIKKKGGTPEKKAVGRPLTTGKPREERKDGFMPTATLREMEQKKTKINFKKQNPKKEGTKAYEKYEKYKSATTVGKALELGATMRDLQNDFEKGFVAKMKTAVAKIDRRPDKAQITPPPSLIASDIKESLRKGRYTVSKTGGRATARDKLKKEGAPPVMAGGKSKRALLKKGEAI